MKNSQQTTQLARAPQKIIISLDSLWQRWPSSMLKWLSNAPYLVCANEKISQSLLHNPLLGILSSHPERNAFRSPTWQHALDCSLEQAKQNGEIVLFPSTAPYAQTIAYACEHYGINHLAITTRLGNPISNAISNSLAINELEINELEIWHANPIAPPKTCPDDIATCALADRIIALNVSPSGKIASLLRKRLACTDIAPHSVWVQALVNPPRKAREHQTTLSQQGAVLWFPSPPPPQHIRIWCCEHRRTPATVQLCAVISEPLRISQDYLIHTTRARQTLWPDQSSLDLLSESFRLNWNPFPTPMETLLRIVTEQRLVATRARKRGPLATVSFTQNSLAELAKIRAFQSHLARWDWEPYGIAIRTEVLSELNAQPVAYLTREQIEQLNPQQQAFCQPTAELESHRDWTIEKEWRMENDLRLACIKPNDAFLFVPTEQEAHLLAHYSKWPVYALGKSTVLVG